jgi:anti-sigma-K factor RskA
VTRTHEELRDALGAHALGQLDDDLRREVDDHLGTCDTCRMQLDELRPVVEALRRLDRDVGGTAGAPPADLDERVRQALSRRPGGGHWVPFGIALAVAAVTAAVTVVVAREDAPTVIAVPRVTVADGVTATAGLVDHTWGLEIKLEATGLRAGERFEVWVLGEDGTLHDAGTFLGVGRTKIVCDMSTSVLLDDATSFRVVDGAGTEVIAAALPHGA